MIEDLIQAMQWSPQAAWFEAIRRRLLPRLADRFHWLKQATWLATEQAFREQRAKHRDVKQAAYELLLDGWLFIGEAFDRPEDSPFAAIAELTREHPSAELRLAHCLRDLCFGDESRADDLVNMVQSPDPDMRQLLVDCFWIDP